MEAVRAERLFIGGKSIGGRIASLVADEAQVAGLVCLGYPFHPTGKPDRLRIEHLQDIRTPTLIVQGERDPFGNRQEVEQYRPSEQVRIYWLLVDESRASRGGNSLRLIDKARAMGRLPAS